MDAHTITAEMELMRGISCWSQSLRTGSGIWGTGFAAIKCSHVLNLDSDLLALEQGTYVSVVT